MTVTETRIGPAQWEEALARTDGRQLVVAGPGTGKTEFLVRRVAHLIDNGKSSRDQLVVLCFSRRAARSLAARIEESIGATGVPVDVTTFHSLALRIGETLRDGLRPTPLTTPEQVGVVAAVLAEEDSGDWPATYRGILTSGAFAAEAADFLMRCSERLLSPADLAERASLRPDWRGLPGLYARYLERLDQLGRTDYGVLLAGTVALLEGDRGRDLASNYRYVLVDEYQDTTPAQAAMSELLAVAHGNITVAGDPYQSIYSFRGAELRNVQAFMELGRCHRIVLDRSLRVPAQIMSAALRVVSGGDLPGAAGVVEPAGHAGRAEAHVFDQETAEAEWIAGEVERAMRVDQVSAERIAVLVRSKKELLGELSRALHRRGIPHDPPQSRLVDHPAVRLIQDIVTVATQGGPLPLTSAVEAAAADRAMRRIMLGPLLGLGLGKERDLFRRRRRTWAPWSHILFEALEGNRGLVELLEQPDWAANGSAAGGFWHIWDHLDGLDPLIEDEARREWRTAWAAFAQALVRQEERDPNLSLAGYFALVEDEDFEAEPLMVHHQTEPRVTLTTLHQAKGLEFEIVFIANASEGVFPDLRRARRMLRPELLSPDRTTDPAAQHLFQIQEEMRLAYTAMTRARSRVVWTATDAGVDQGERRPSRFLVAVSGRSLSELGPPSDAEGEPVTVSETEIMMRRRLLDPDSPPHERLSAAGVLGGNQGSWWDLARFPGVSEPGPDKPILGDRFRLSPSQAEAYRTCPRRYALERRLRLGDANTPYSRFGTLVHAALERAESEVIGTGRLHNEVERALECLREAWAEADFGTPELDAAWLSKAADLVTKLYERWPVHDGVPVALEEKVSAVIEDVEWAGVVDRVERVDGGLRVVDYKTSSSAMTDEDSRSSVQLAFYALAAGTPDDPVVDAQFWYPRTSAKSVTTRSLDIGTLDEVREEMSEITRSIGDEDWSPRAGAHCQTCGFRRSCPAWPEGQGAYLP